MEFIASWASKAAPSQPPPPNPPPLSPSAENKSQRRQIHKECRLNDFSFLSRIILIVSLWDDTFTNVFGGVGRVPFCVSSLNKITLPHPLDQKSWLPLTLTAINVTFPKSPSSSPEDRKRRSRTSINLTRMAWLLHKCFRRCFYAVLWLFRLWVVLFSSLGLISLAQHGRCPTESYEAFEGTKLLN